MSNSITSCITFSSTENCKLFICTFHNKTLIFWHVLELSKLTNFNLEGTFATMYVACFYPKFVRNFHFKTLRSSRMNQFFPNKVRDVGNYSNFNTENHQVLIRLFRLERNFYFMYSHRKIKLTALQALIFHILKQFNTGVVHYQASMMGFL